jgi:hypothetical protein
VLVAIPLAGSLIFTAMLAYRPGHWWRGTELQGRHAAACVRQQLGEDQELADDSTGPARPIHSQRTLVDAPC